MTLNNFTSGINTGFSDELNENFNAIYSDSFTQNGLNLIRQLQDRNVNFSEAYIDGFAEAYTSESGRKGNVITSETGATYDSGSNTYAPVIFKEDYYWVIEADSLNPSGISTSDIEVAKEFGANRWLIYVPTNDSNALKRAKVYEELFINNGISSASNITSIKTSVTGDVGKTAYTTDDSVSEPGFEEDTKGGLIKRDLTFDSTTSNQDVTVWADLKSSAPTSNSSASEIVELPKGDEVYRLDGQDDTTVQEFNIGTSNERTANNPGDGFIQVETDGTNDAQDDGESAFVKTLILTKEGINFGITTSSSGDGNEPNFSTSSTDFKSDGVPAFESKTSINAEKFLSTVVHGVPDKLFEDNVSRHIGVPKISGWYDEADIRVQGLNAQGEATGWSSMVKPQFTDFSQFSSGVDKVAVELNRPGIDYSLGLTNPSFEDNSLNGWTFTKNEDNNTTVTGSIVTDMFGSETDGSQSYKIDFNGDDYEHASGTLTSNDFDGSKTQQLAVDYAWENLNDIGGNVEFRVNSQNGTVSTSVSVDESNSPNTGTIFLTIPVAKQTTNSSINLEVDVDGHEYGPNGVFWFDNVRLIDEQPYPLIKGFYYIAK